MAAVIGSKDNLNRDPLKMGRFYASSLYSSPKIPNANSAVQYGTDYANTNYFTSVTNAASNANAAKQLYTVSGKGGFLILAFSSMPDSSGLQVNVTYVVTVDGVATTIILGASGSASDGYLQGWLGTPASIYRAYSDRKDFTNVATASHNGFSFPDHLGNIGIGHGKTSLATGTVNYQGGNNGEYGSILLPSLNQPTTNPQACVRFETSLTVTVAVDYANTSSTTDRRWGGVLVRLDS